VCGFAPVRLKDSTYRWMLSENWCVAVFRRAMSLKELFKALLLKIVTFSEAPQQDSRQLFVELLFV